MATWTLPLLAALLLAPQGAPGGTDPLQDSAGVPGEGPLENDVFLPVVREAELLLARGDAAYAALLGGSQEPGERVWVEILESWHQALERGTAGDSVSPRPWNAGPGGDSPWPDPDGTAGGGASDRPVRPRGIWAVARLRPARPRRSPCRRGSWC